MRELLRQNFRFFVPAALSALVLRLLFLRWLPNNVTSDTLIYGDIAKNWLLHGVYGLTQAGLVVPTCIRLPGYPAFLAALFAVFGLNDYHAVLLVQVFVDMGTCLLIADMAYRVASPRAAKAAFLLAGLCPFLATYAAAALTETLEIFFTALALDFALRGIQSLPKGKIIPWLYSGLAIGAAILLRPDGGLLLIGIGIYLLWLLLRPQKPNHGSFTRMHVFRAGLALALAALAPLLPWTLRNLHTLHQFQPLAPRYSNDQKEFVPLGFNRWVRTWIADYVSVEEIYWNVPGEPIDVSNLPARAFDSESQRKETTQLFADYNRTLRIPPSIDARFAALAAMRIHAAPLRYYLLLPAVRIADMWLRPRTELFPSDTRWWEFNDDPKWSALAVALGIVGLLYPLAAFLGLVRTKFTLQIALLLAFVVVRSAFLGMLENPEPRYVLECYPAIIVFICLLFRREANRSRLQ